MSKKFKKPTKTSLEIDLLHFYDNYIEFHDHCSFLCDAFAGLTIESDCLDSSTTMGVSRYSHWVKRRAQELKQDLKQIHEKSCVQGKRMKKP